MNVSHEDEHLSVRVELLDDGFIAAPTGEQRHTLVTELLGEFVDELRHLDEIAVRFVPAPSPNTPYPEEWQRASAVYDDSELLIDGHQVMQDWEAPLMRALAERVTASHGDVLELGFGMGISATYIQELGARSHTIVEANDEVVVQFERWRAAYPDRDIRLIHGYWQDTVDRLESYDGILFDTYPASVDESEVTGTVEPQAASFFPVAARVLRPGGVFTYFTDEIDSLSRPHQRFLLRHFERIEIAVVRDLKPPPGCRYWWADSMAVVSSIRSEST
jgi:guanidinoacetate N-methyltransferase